MKKTLRVFILLMLSAIVLAGCNNSRRLLKGKPLKNRTPASIIKKNETANFDFDYLGMKLVVDFLQKEEEQSFKANIKIKKDSMIWISITPALGIEVIRVVITQDSVKYISKIPKNKYYYEGDFSVISDVTKMDLDFAMIQNILVGNPVLLDKQDDKLVSVIDDRNYGLISKFDRKLKRILKFDEKKLGINDSIEMDPFSKTYYKVRKKAAVDELLLKRFWIDGYNYNLTKALYNDYYNFRDISINYTDFKVYENQYYPSKGSVRVDSPDSWQELKFKIARIRVGKKYKFPYEIPDGYGKKDDI